MQPRHDHSPSEIEQRFPRAIRRDTQTTPPPEPDVIPYRYRYYTGIVVGVLAALVGAIQLAGPTDLGFSPVAARWLGVFSSLLVLLAGVLPNPFGGSRKPPQEKG